MNTTLAAFCQLVCVIGGKWEELLLGLLARCQPPLFCNDSANDLLGPCAGSGSMPCWLEEAVPTGLEGSAEPLMGLSAQGPTLAIRESIATNARCITPAGSTSE